MYTVKPNGRKSILWSKVSEMASGLLQLVGDGFSLSLKYNPKVVSPKIEFNQVEDDKLKKYWPNGITRIVFELKSPGITGKNEFVITKAAK